MSERQKVGMVSSEGLVQQILVSPSLTLVCLCCTTLTLPKAPLPTARSR